MAGDGHNGAGTVAHQHVIRDKDGDLLPVDGVDGGHAFQLDAGLVLGHLGALEVGFPGGGLLIGLHRVPVGDAVLPLLQIGMLRGHDHVRNAEQGVGTGGEDGKDIAGSGGEVDLRALGPADPVGLLHLDPVDKVHILQVVDEALGVFGDGQHPLALFLADHRGAAALADAVDHLFVGQDTLAAGAPVDRHGSLISQALFKELLEDPLGPLVIVRVDGGHLTAPVKAQAQRGELLFEVGDVGPGEFFRMHMVFDGVVLGGQAEGVPAHGIQNIVALHPLFPGHDVQGGVGTGMAHVQARSGGIGELHQGVKFGLGVVIGGVKHAGFLPLGLPFLFDAVKFVFHFVSSSFTVRLEMSIRVPSPHSRSRAYISLASC